MIDKFMEEMNKRRNVWAKDFKAVSIEGKKYFKITDRERSAEAFIDKTTGEIFKSASWNAPAKHARGNVNSPTNGTEALDGMGFIKYLK